MEFEHLRFLCYCLLWTLIVLYLYKYCKEAPLISKYSCVFIDLIHCTLRFVWDLRFVIWDFEGFTQPLSAPQNSHLPSPAH